MSTSI